MKRWPALLGLAAAVTACMLPKTVYFEDEASHLARHDKLAADHGVDCLPEYLPPDETTVPRPDARPADHRFAGDFTGQLEHVWLEGESYSSHAGGDRLEAELLRSGAPEPGLPALDGRVPERVSATAALTRHQRSASSSSAQRP